MWLLIVFRGTLNGCRPRTPDTKIPSTDDSVELGDILPSSVSCPASSVSMPASSSSPFLRSFSKRLHLWSLPASCSMQYTV